MQDKFQYLAALVASLITVCFGITEGWPSPITLLLMSNESPLMSGPISLEEASWVVSLLYIGCLFGNMFFVTISNIFGRKISLLVITIPTIISWLMVLFAPNVYYLYAARLLNGFVGGAGYVITPLFLSEIANDRVRGTLVSTLTLSENVGILLGFVFGHYFNYSMIPIFVILLSILFGVLFMFFPESATFLVKNNKIAEAEKSIKFYQNLEQTEKGRKIVEFEITKLKSTLDSAHTANSDRRSLTIADLLTGVNRKALTIGIVMVFLNQFSGCAAMLNYTAYIFQESGSSMSPNMSAIVVGVIQVIGACFATYLVDRAGRKILFAISTIGTALGLTILGIYMMLKSWGVEVENFNWIPLASFSFGIFIAAVAILTLPFTLLSEVMPERSKDLIYSLCMILLWIFAFLTSKFLPLLTDTIGLHGSMYLYSAVCIISEVYLFTCVPETKGKSNEEIMELLR